MIRVGAFFLLWASSTVAYADGPVRSEAQLLRSYAAAQCIARAYPNTTTASDAKAAAAGYLEFGNVDADAYSEAVKLAEKALQHNYRGKKGEPLHVMKCIDLMFSPALDTLVERYAPTAKK